MLLSREPARHPTSCIRQSKALLDGHGVVRLGCVPSADGPREVDMTLGRSFGVSR